MLKELQPKNIVTFSKLVESTLLFFVVQEM